MSGSTKSAGTGFVGLQLKRGLVHRIYTEEDSVRRHGIHKPPAEDETSPEKAPGGPSKHHRAGADCTHERPKENACHVHVTL